MSVALSAWISTLGWTLLHFLWQGAVVGGAAAIALILLRRARPQARYAVVWLALALCLLWPLADAAERFLALSAAPSWTLASAPTDWRAALERHLPWLVALWCGGVGVMATRLSFGLLWVHRLRRESEVWDDPAWLARVRRLATRLEVRRRVALRVVTGLDGPVTVGWLRPVILVPAALVARMPPDLLEALLAHEMAHIRRLDYLANLLQSLIETLLFYHPAVWWLSRRLRVERELIADDLAAAALDRSRCLPEALGELSRHRAESAALAQAAHGGELLGRIKRLVRPEAQPLGWRGLLPLLGTALVGVALQAQALIAPPPAETPAKSAPALQDLRLDSRHALVVADDGEILLEKDAHRVVPIASLTKLMTAMVVLDAGLDMRQRLRIAPGDVDTLKHSPSRVPVGTELSRARALELALGASDNRAAKALARTYPGGEAAFVRALQDKIAALGLRHTALHEPTGLSPRNTSTAAEMARMAQAAGRYPEIARLTTGAAKPPGQKWDVQLAKTGFTREAGRCLTLRLKTAEGFVTLVLLDAAEASTRLLDANSILRRLGNPSADPSRPAASG